MGRHAYRFAAAWIMVIAVAWISPPASAQIYKCVEHGQLALQDSPCPKQAKATVIDTQPPPRKDFFSDLPPEPLPTFKELIRKTDYYARPDQVSFDLLEPLIRKFEARKRHYQAGMDRDLKIVREHFYGSLRDQGRRQGLTSDWKQRLSENSQRVRQLTAEDTRMHREYSSALQAARDSSASSGYGTQAPHAQADAIARVHAEWDPKLHDIDAQLRAAVQAGSRQNQSYLANLHAYQPTRDVHLVHKGFEAYERRVQDHWLIFIRATDLEVKALKDELRRRCAADPVLAAERPVCRQALTWKPSGIKGVQYIGQVKN